MSEDINYNTEEKYILDPLLQSDEQEEPKPTEDNSKEAHSEGRWRRSYVIPYVCIIGFGSFMWGIYFYPLSLLGFGMLALTPNITTLQKIYAWNKTQEAFYIALLTAIGCAGGLAGALSSGILAPYGRRKVLRLTCLIVIVGSIFNLFISLPCLIIGRIVIGYASGIFATLCPLFIIEVSPKEVRGSFGSFHQLFITIGILLCMTMGFALPDPDAVEQHPDRYPWLVRNWWRIIFAFPIIPAIILILLLTYEFPLETPRYYANNSQKHLDKNRVKKEVQECEIMASEAGKDLTYKQLFSPKFLRLTLVGCSSMVIEQFSGINFVQLYSTSIFESAQGEHSSHNTTAMMNLILGFVPLTFNLITIYYVEKVGRRTLLLWTTGACAFIHIANGLFQEFDITYAQVAMIYLYLADYYVALGPVLWLYIGEVMPDKALSLAVSSNWISAIIITFALYPLAKLLIGFQGVFYFLGVVMFASIIFEYIFILETKGKSITEVLSLFTRTELHSKNSIENIQGRQDFSYNYSLFFEVLIIISYLHLLYLNSSLQI